MTWADHFNFSSYIIFSKIKKKSMWSIYSEWLLQYLFKSLRTKWCEIIIEYCVNNYYKMMATPLIWLLPKFWRAYSLSLYNFYYSPCPILGWWPTSSIYTIHNFPFRLREDWVLALVVRLHYWRSYAKILHVILLYFHLVFVFPFGIFHLKKLKW